MTTASPMRLGHRARRLLVVGMGDHEPRAQQLDAVAASGSVKLGLIGASAAPSLLAP